MNLYWIAGAILVGLVIWFVALPWYRRYKVNQAAKR